MPFCSAAFFWRVRLKSDGNEPGPNVAAKVIYAYLLLLPSSPFLWGGIYLSKKYRNIR